MRNDSTGSTLEKKGLLLWQPLGFSLLTQCAKKSIFGPKIQIDEKHLQKVQNIWIFANKLVENVEFFWHIFEVKVLSKKFLDENWSFYKVCNIF